MMGRRLVTSIAVVAALSIAVPAGAQSFIEKLLRIAGLTAAPSQMKGPGDEVEPGDIWVANIEQRTTKALTDDGGYRSPVFSPAGGGIHALKGDTIVRIAADGRRSTLAKVPGAIKLVGFDGKSPDDLVVLLEAEPAGSPLAVLSLKSGTVTPLPYDAKSEDQRRILAHIRGQDRVYGDARVYAKTESKRGLLRNIEWTDVYFQLGNAAPQNVSACDGVNCAQPALSPDGRSVAFIKLGS